MGSSVEIITMPKASNFASIFVYGEKKSGKPRQYILEELSVNQPWKNLVHSNRYIELNILLALLNQLKTDKKLLDNKFNSSNWTSNLPLSPDGYGFNNLPKDDQLYIKQIQSKALDKDSKHKPQDSQGGFFSQNSKKRERCKMSGS